MGWLVVAPFMLTTKIRIDNMYAMNLTNNEKLLLLQITLYIFRILYVQTYFITVAVKLSVFRDPFSLSRIFLHSRSVSRF